MNHHLIDVVGPSGAGKDSLMRWLRQRLGDRWPVHWARRTVTRSAHDSSEQDISLDPESFEQADRMGQFALQWQANGMRYGVRHEELMPISKQHWVFLNGSRAHIQTCAERYPGLTILHITAQPEVLRQRLLQRGRETQEMVQARIQRSPELLIPPQSIWLEVHNNGDVDEAGRRMLEQLNRLPGWPCHE